MSQGDAGADAVPLSTLRASDLERRGVLFSHEGMLFRTTGDHVGNGGMGNAFALARGTVAGGVAELEAGHLAVGKVFHSEYLYQLRTDEITRRDHDAVLARMSSIADVAHPHVLPILVSAPIADNHITVTPRQSATLLHAVSTGSL